jgi:transposase
VGPDHFGIVSIDCGKSRSKWLFCDFYGTLLVPPTTLPHTAEAFRQAVACVKQTAQQHLIRDTLVAVEMTGIYHRPVQRAFQAAGFETRLVHPFASRHFRQPASPDIKTDDIDLGSIFRAAVNGFGLLEPQWPEVYSVLQLLARHGRDLVEKRSLLQCQIRHYLGRCLPGYADLFEGDALWKRAWPLYLARRGQTPQQILQAGIPGVNRWLREQKFRLQQRSVQRVLAWAANAPTPENLTPHLSRVWLNLYEDWQNKSQQITQLEQESAEMLAKTPYLLLLSHPGINVVSAAELAGEMGPIEYYSSPRAVTGRAGLFPSRYQSDEVDHPDGPLAKYRNARLRAAWLLIADNLIKCNAYFHGKYFLWKQAGVDPRNIRCRIANRAVRAIFHMVSGRCLYRHPSRLQRGYVLDKLLKFHEERNTPPPAILRDLQQAAQQIPEQDRAAEAEELQGRYERLRRSRLAGPKAIGELLLVVLERYGITDIPLKAEALSPDAAESDVGTR